MPLRDTINYLLVGETKSSTASKPPHLSPMPMQQPFPPPPQQQVFQQPMHRTPSPMQQPVPSIPWLLISKTDIRSSQNNAPLFHISQSAAPGSLSSKSLVTVTRASSGVPLGTIRIRSSTETIELEFNGIPTELTTSSMSLSFKYSYNPVTYPGARWVWSEKDKGLNLTDGDKNGRLLARIDGQTLVCENIGLTEAAVDEIILSAVAVLVKKKKLGKDAEAAEGMGELVSALAGGGS